MSITHDRGFRCRKNMIFHTGNARGTERHTGPIRAQVVLNNIHICCSSVLTFKRQNDVALGCVRSRLPALFKQYFVLDRSAVPVAASNKAVCHTERAPLNLTSVSCNYIHGQGLVIDISGGRHKPFHRCLVELTALVRDLSVEILECSRAWQAKRICRLKAHSCLNFESWYLKFGME